MPFIVRVLQQDLDAWEEYSHEISISDAYLRDRERTGRFFYRIKFQIYDPVLAAVSLKSPARLESLVGQDMHLYISVERGFLSKTIHSTSRVLLLLQRPNRQLEGDVRRLRLRIERIDRSYSPPRIFLTELKNCSSIPLNL